MIVVRPAQSQPILAHLLCLPRSIALLPISPLFRKNDVASKVPSDEREHSIECRLQMTITFLVIVKDPATSLPNLVRLRYGRPLASSLQFAAKPPSNRPNRAATSPSQAAFVRRGASQSYFAQETLL